MAESGGLEAPDPNRPYQSRPQPSKVSAPQARGTQHTHAAPAPGDQAVAAAVQKQTPGRGQQAECKQSGTRASRLAQDRAPSQPPAARKSDTPEGRVLAKLGLSKGGQQASKAAAASPLPSAGVSGEYCGLLSASMHCCALLPELSLKHITFILTFSISTNRSHSV